MAGHPKCTHLQLQALIQHHPALHPCFLQVCTFLIEDVKFLLDLRAGIVPMSQQLLPKLLKCLESASPGVNFCPVFLPRGGNALGIWQKMHMLVSTTGSQLRLMGEGAQQTGLPTWCRSSKASAPVTSLANSSEDTSPRIPLIQDMRSLENRPTGAQPLHYLESGPLTRKMKLHHSCLRRLFWVNLITY